MDDLNAGQNVLGTVIDALTDMLPIAPGGCDACRAGRNNLPPE